MPVFVSFPLLPLNVKSHATKTLIVVPDFLPLLFQIQFTLVLGSNISFFSVVAVVGVVLVL
jgi:hypothetical protein